jgi:putative membrane protein
MASELSAGVFVRLDKVYTRRNRRNIMISQYLRGLPYIGLGIALAAGTSLMAQAPGGGPPSSMPQQPQTQPQNAPMPGNTGMYPGNQPTAENMGERAFVTKAMQGDAAEVQLGQLAQQKSQSNDVKQLAQKLVTDHTQMDQNLKPLAKQLGMSEPNGPSKKDKKMMEKLQGLSGNDFDTQYLTMMLKDHQQDLKDFQQEAQSAQDPNLKQIAGQGATVISQHLQMVEQVAKAHNIAVSEKPSSR